MPGFAQHTPRPGSLFLAALVTLTTYSYLRGQRELPEAAGQIYYFINYSSGVIHRGLIGQIFTLIWRGATPDAVLGAAVLVHKLASMALMFALLLWSWARMTAPRRFTARRLGLIYLVFAASQFLPTLALTNTYLDVYYFLLAAAGFALLVRRRDGLALAIGLVGPLIHEMFAFLWVCAAIMVVWQRGAAALRRPLTLLACLSPLISWAALQMASSPLALATQMDRVPLQAAFKANAVKELLTHSVGKDLAVMQHLYALHGPRAGISIALFTAPTLVMMVLAFPALTRRDRLYLAAASLAPLGVLALEFDLSRFVVMSQLTGLLAILFMADTPPPAAMPPDRAPPPALAWALAPCLAVLFSLPGIYAYFDKTMWVTNEVLDSVPWLGPHLRALYPAG